MSSNEQMIERVSERAADLLAPLGNRWLHVQGVVERARSISLILKEEDRPYLIAAAYMHDIGYAPSLKKTGFHPIDGACYVCFLAYDRLASLVAYHSEARFEAHIRGLDAALHQFPREQSALSDALTYCDLTTSATGVQVSLKERVTDIFRRYGDTDTVTLAFRQALPYLSLAVARTTRRINKLRELSVVTQ